MYVCICQGVTDKTIRKAVQQGVCSLPQLQMNTGCATHCGRCSEHAEQILDEELGKASQSFLPVFTTEPELSGTLA